MNHCVWCRPASGHYSHNKRQGWKPVFVFGKSRDSSIAIPHVQIGGGEGGADNRSKNSRN